jgi:dTDP-4-amino-4,6-dideoxygalactose transaminase
MNPIQLFVPKYRVEECLNEIRICLEKGWTGAGFKTIEFEEAWMAYTQLPYAHFLSSATAGLHLALKLLKEENNWQDGDEVITTPLTFVSTNHAILYENMVPVFADVDRFLCIDPDSLEPLITPKTRAIIFVGLGGNYGQLDRIAEFCRAKDIKLILDAAHMAGTRFKGKHVGQEADVTVFSFQAVKNLPTADSGMICFADQKLDAEVRKWSWLGINKDSFSRTLSKGAYKWHYDVEVEGFKYHGNSIMAALALVGLKYLDQDNAYRRQIASWYEDFLGDSVDIVPNRDGCESSRHLVQVMVDGRDEIMLALNDHGIYPGVHYRDNTSYKMYRNRLGSTRNSQRASDRIISLPMHLGLSYQDVQRTSQALLDALAFKKTSGELTHNA